MLCLSMPGVDLNRPVGVDYPSGSARDLLILIDPPALDRSHILIVLFVRRTKTRRLVRLCLCSGNPYEFGRYHGGAIETY